jgi:hypothetical protein
LRERGSLPSEDGLAGLNDFPVKVDTGGVEYSFGSCGQLGTDAVTWNERHAMGHGGNSSGWLTGGATKREPGGRRGRRGPPGRRLRGDAASLGCAVDASLPHLRG